MRIQIISQAYYPDDFRINDIAAELVNKGHTVKVLTGLPDYATTKIPMEFKWLQKRNEYVDGVQVTRLPIIARRKGIIFRTLNYLSFVVSS
ncbi:MAG: glycosyltransferase WbuB, partial [Oscillospiraceae bacterium]